MYLLEARRPHNATYNTLFSLETYGQTLTLTSGLTLFMIFSMNIMTEITEKLLNRECMQVCNEYTHNN